MNLKFSNPHRSIENPFEISFPDFTVITGENGSGKTHFLEAINLHFISTNIEGEEIQTGSKEIIYIYLLTRFFQKNQTM